MEKFCFTKYNNGQESLLVCAHEKDYNDSGSYVSCKYDDFEKLETDKKIEMINDMIIAVSKSCDVKNNIKFSDYNR